MDIADTRQCNFFNLEMLARYQGVPVEVLTGYYEELLGDQEFLGAVNRRITEIRVNWGFRKGIFAMPTIPSVDWFAFERVLIYVLIRHLKPNWVLETGVYYGGNSAFALLALARNKGGKMISIDYPDSEIREKGTSETRHSLVGDSELYDPTLRPGFMVPPFLHERWTYVMLTESTITYETMMGVYNPKTWKRFAPWAPREGTTERETYLMSLRDSVQQRLLET